MSNTIKINLTFCFIFLIYFPTKSNQIDKEQSTYIEESTIEFEILKFVIEVNKEDPKFITFDMEFKAKRDNVWLPCEYDLDFWTDSEENKWGFYTFKNCSWSSESGLPQLESVETNLTPAEYRKTGRLLIEKMKAKGFVKEAEKAIQLIDFPNKNSCGTDFFH